MPLHAKWIWKPQAERRPHFQTVEFLKSFTLPTFHRAVLRIAADTRYRLFANGEWGADGPCRSWPEQFRYDEIDLTPHLRQGRNVLRILAQFWSIGCFQRDAREAGFIAQLDIDLARGRKRRIATDRSWRVSNAPEFASNATKICVQMGPQEQVDARNIRRRFVPARELYRAESGPWRNLAPRDVPLLTRKPLLPREFLGARNLQHSSDLVLTLPARRILRDLDPVRKPPGAVPCALASVLRLRRPGILRFDAYQFAVSVGGRKVGKRGLRLPAGRHILLAFVSEVLHVLPDKRLRLVDPPPLEFENPFDARLENPYALLTFPELPDVLPDAPDSWTRFREQERETFDRAYKRVQARTRAAAKDRAGFARSQARRALQMPTKQMFTRDVDWRLDGLPRWSHRKTMADSQTLVRNPQALCAGNAESAVVRPAAGVDVQLLYDFGEQTVGYYEFRIDAPAGVELSIHGCEYVGPDGTVQFPGGNRALVYTTREGDNSFLSMERRGGRYAFLTFRNLRAPVRVRSFRIVESLYPARPFGSFESSDAALDRFWHISRRTLELCMEDTFTDCPTYEQTLWIGDARNEALFAYDAFGAADLAEHCLRLGAESLARSPMVTCIAPSDWRLILPAWSFLWGLNVWEHYFYTGDRAFLREFWPAVRKNLDGAARFVDSRGLFSAPTWNILDWSGLDQYRRTVLHNSLLFVGAIDAALRCARELGQKPAATQELRALRRTLVNGVNATWDPERRAYPDSIHDDGKPSQTASEHTSLLALLFDVVPNRLRHFAVENIVGTRKDLVRIGTLFAMMFRFETLQKLGREETIVESIRETAEPMLAAGATTVWEALGPGWTPGRGAPPTRSHCHAWSSTAIPFFARVLLGVRQTAPGGRAYTVSPRPCRLSRAAGTVATARGPLSVAWRIEGDRLFVRIDAPPGVRVRFVRNPALAALRVKREQSATP